MTMPRERAPQPDDNAVSLDADVPTPPSADRASRRLPYVRRRYKRSGGLFVGSMALWLAGIALLLLTSRAQMAGRSAAASQLVSNTFTFAFAPPVLLGCVFGVWNGVWQRRVQRTVAAAEFRCCPNCLYDLRGVKPSTGEKPLGSETLSGGVTRCPECGGSANLGESEMLWRAWIGRRQVARLER